jgi:hypothetical protein
MKVSFIDGTNRNIIWNKPNSKLSKGTEKLEDKSSPQVLVEFVLLDR